MIRAIDRTNITSIGFNKVSWNCRGVPIVGESTPVIIFMLKCVLCVGNAIIQKQAHIKSSGL